MKKMTLTLLLLLLLPAIATAYDFEKDGIYYNIIDDGLEVTYRYSSGESYNGEIVIPEIVLYEGISYKVIAIGERAFYYSKLTSVSIPSTVCRINDYAFYNCTSLTSIIIPESVTSIGKWAIAYCESLNSILIPNSVVSIATAFPGCNSLSSIVVDNGNPVYDSRNECNAIIETASNTLISGCKSTVIPNSVSTIGSSAFSNCADLLSLIIPASVTNIDDFAFWCDYSLTNIIIPNNVTSIGSCAFGACGLKSISIPSTVASIGAGAFTGCGSLTRIIVEDDNSFYDSRNNCNAIIETSSNTLLRGCLNTVIPNSVVKIGASAFSDCSNLSNILIPPSVTTIERDAFVNCGGLKSMTIPNSVTSIDPDAFSGSSGLTTVYVYGSGEWLAGSLPKNSKIKELYIGSDITSVNSMGVNPTNIYCFGLIPPACNAGSFTAYAGKLHVPASSLASYFTASYWCNFPNIIGDVVIPESINIYPDTLELFIGEQEDLVAAMLPYYSYSYNINWITSNSDVAIINNGQVSAVSEGECDLFASCFDLVSSCHLIVRSSTISIYLDKQDVQILPNHIVIIKPSSSSAIMPELTVSSSDPTIAVARIMNGEVQVVGIKEGTTTITVGSADGTAIPATCLVTVYTEPGDLNSDGFVTISDVTSLIDYLLGGDDTQISSKNADVNGDGNISISDVTTLIDQLLSSGY